MNFILVEVILSTGMFKSIGIRIFLESYVVYWLNLSENEYKMKHFFPKITLSRSFLPFAEPIRSPWFRIACQILSKFL